MASGKVLPEHRLIRYALAPDGAVVPDIAAKLPGRGAWVEATRVRIGEAVKKGGFARAFKANAKAPDNLADWTESLLAKRCLDFLGLARKAGAIAFGATQVDAAFRSRPVPAWIEASDGAEDGRMKFSSLHKGLWGKPAPLVGCFSAADLGMALGRERVIHACLLQERLALAWAVEIGRLAGFRAIAPHSWPDSWPLLAPGLGDAVVEPFSSRSASSDVTLEEPED